MKTNILRALGGALLALASFTGSALAQDVQLASATDMNNIYARLAELESRVAASNVAYWQWWVAAATAGCESDCDDCCDRSGCIVGAEVLLLRAYESDGDFNDVNYDEAFRFWIGWQGAGGLGVRLRYFDYDETGANGDTVRIGVRGPGNLRCRAAWAAIGT